MCSVFSLSVLDVCASGDKILPVMTLKLPTLKTLGFWSCSSSMACTYCPFCSYVLRFSSSFGTYFLPVTHIVYQVCWLNMVKCVSNEINSFIEIKASSAYVQLMLHLTITWHIGSLDCLGLFSSQLIPPSLNPLSLPKNNNDANEGLTIFRIKELCCLLNIFLYTTFFLSV